MSEISSAIYLDGCMDAGGAKHRTNLKPDLVIWISPIAKLNNCMEPRRSIWTVAKGAAGYQIQDELGNCLLLPRDATKADLDEVVRLHNRHHFLSRELDNA